jgi:hypothetical protein
MTSRNNKQLLKTREKNQRHALPTSGLNQFIFINDVTEKQQATRHHATEKSGSMWTKLNGEKHATTKS